jgi:hypothetical protein
MVSGPINVNPKCYTKMQHIQTNLTTSPPAKKTAPQTCFSIVSYNTFARTFVRTFCSDHLSSAVVLSFVWLDDSKCRFDVFKVLF